MRLAVTADLHWGHGPEGDAATRELARKVAELAPDVFAVAGDVGEGREFGACLAQFGSLSCPRLVVPGNHDLWTGVPGAASLTRYEEELAQIAASHGFHYLDHAPYILPGGEAVLGSINWYDYSFADPELEREFPDAPRMYRFKLFPDGRHNDGRFVKLGMTDEAFTVRVVERFEAQLAALGRETERVIVLQHHPPVRELFYPTPITSVVGRFWLAYTGNRAMQEGVLADPRIRWVVCGHTHAACEADVAGKRCLNVGGDYRWKRLLLIDTETGEERAWEFHAGENSGSG